MGGWEQLEQELDRWTAAGKAATFWWRDDDAIAATPALDRMLSLRAEAGPPLHLSVIPATVERSLSDRIRDCASVVVLQHGYAHVNHSPRGRKKSECGVHRPVPQILDELERGSRILADSLPNRYRRVFVPPWNRIESALLPELALLGYAGVSAFGPRARGDSSYGLERINTHVDIIDWTGSRGFIGIGSAVDQVVQHLTARRTGAADPSEPTGLLTHHLVHDEACWIFTREFLLRTSHYPGALWLKGDDVFSHG